MKLEMTRPGERIETKLDSPPDRIDGHRICITPEVDETEGAHITPLCRVPFHEKLCYVVDGNQRFQFFKLKNPNKKKLQAWIVREYDQYIIQARDIPAKILRFLNGDITCDELLQRARVRGLESV